MSESWDQERKRIAREKLIRDITWFGGLGLLSLGLWVAVGFAAALIGSGMGCIIYATAKSA